jgi:dynactin-5
MLENVFDVVCGEYTSTDFILTSTGNIVSRTVKMCKPQQIEIPSGKCIMKANVIIRGDFAPVQINRYTMIEENTVIRPPYIMTSGQFRFIPLTIGKNTFIGADCVIESACIGVGCYIGKGCVLSKRCILKDYVVVDEGTVIPPDMVIPPFSIVSGQPAKIVGEMPPSTPTAAEAVALARYKGFVLVTP